MLLLSSIALASFARLAIAQTPVIVNPSAGNLPRAGHDFTLEFTSDLPDYAGADWIDSSLSLLSGLEGSASSTGNSNDFDQVALLADHVDVSKQGSTFVTFRMPCVDFNGAVYLFSLRDRSAAAQTPGRLCDRIPVLLTVAEAELSRSYVQSTARFAIADYATGAVDPVDHGETRRGHAVGCPVLSSSSDSTSSSTTAIETSSDSVTTSVSEQPTPPASSTSSAPIPDQPGQGGESPAAPPAASAPVPVEGQPQSPARPSPTSAPNSSTGTGSSRPTSSTSTDPSGNAGATRVGGLLGFAVIFSVVFAL